MTATELMKNIASWFSCIISGITLVGIIIKPVRKAFLNKIVSVAHVDQIKLQEQRLAKEDEKINRLTNICEQNAKDIQELKQIISENKADSLRGELFNCGNRCRRGIPLAFDEFRYIQTVWQKYHEQLHCNGIGEEEYHYIVKYYESQNHNKGSDKN